MLGGLFVFLLVLGCALYLLALYVALPSFFRVMRKLRCRILGTRPGGGSLKPSASTGTKEPGTQTRGMGTLAECSFSLERGAALAGIPVQTWLRRANSFIAPSSSTEGTETLGVSGEPRPDAASGETVTSTNRRPFLLSFQASLRPCNSACRHSCNPQHFEPSRISVEAR